MSGVKCRKYVLKSYFSGFPKKECLELVEETLPALKDGGNQTVDACREQLDWLLPAS